MDFKSVLFGPLSFKTNHMTEKVQKINNPLTIIAIFAALAEISATVSIGLIDKSLHSIFIWFLIGFPTLLVVTFFITLNFNTKAMYSPSDYREDKTFLDSLYGQGLKENSSNLNNELFNKKLEEFEEKMIKSMEEKFKQNSSKTVSETDIKQLLEEYKTEIKTFTETNNNSNAIDLKIPSLLKSSIVKWISFPAFIPIIYAIVKEDCKSVSDISKIEDKYNLPVRWNESGILNLFKSNILVGNNKKFNINNFVKDSLENWILLNEETIVSIVKIFGDEDERSRSTVSQKARNLTQNLII